MTLSAEWPESSERDAQGGVLTWTQALDGEQEEELADSGLSHAENPRRD